MSDGSNFTASVFDNPAMMHILVSRLMNERRYGTAAFGRSSIDWDSVDWDAMKEEISRLMDDPAGRQYIISIVEEERRRADRLFFHDIGFSWGESLGAVAVCLAIPFALWIIIKVIFFG